MCFSNSFSLFLYWLDKELDGPGFESRERYKIFFFSKSFKLRGPQSLLFNGYRVSFRKRSGRSVNFIGYLHLMPRIRMSGAISPCHLHAFNAWRGASLPVIFLQYRIEFRYPADGDIYCGWLVNCWTVEAPQYHIAVSAFLIRVIYQIFTRGV
jgi:hypothetical protein